MYENVKRYLRENKMIEEGDTVLAGVSGGGDSMAMLYFLKRYQEECAFELRAIHVHHGIRGQEAERDEQLVERVCREWQIPFGSYHYDVPALAVEWKLGTEETGRIVRKNAFEKERIRLGLSEEKTKIALAHNENDVAETLIHNLCRGSGLRGLTSLRPKADRIIRPILDLSKKQILAFLQERKIPYVVDSTNLEDDYTRNRIRHTILPAMEREINPQATAHLAGTAGLLSQAQEYLEHQAAELLADSGSEENGQILLADGFFASEPILVSYGILQVFERMTGKRRDFTAVHVENVKQLAHMTVGKRQDLPYGLTARKEYHGVSFRNTVREFAHSKEKDPKREQTLYIPGITKWEAGVLHARILDNNGQKIEEKKYTKWLDYDNIKSSLCIRTRRSGDYFIADQKGSRKKLNRFFIDEKIPAEKRDEILLVADGSEILWIIGWRISESYKITPKTGEILELHYQGGYVE